MQEHGLLLLAREQVVDESADTAGRCANSCAFLASRQRADRGACTSAPADDHGFLFPGALIRMRRLRPRLDDARRAGDLVACGMVDHFHGMQSLLVAQVHDMWIVGTLLRN